MERRDLSRRPPAAWADGDSFATGTHAAPARAEAPPVAGERRSRVRGRLPQAPGVSASGGLRLESVVAAVLAAVVVLVAGCGVGGNTTEQIEDPGGKEARGTASSTVSGEEGEEPEPEDDESGFVASAKSSGGEVGAADRIEGARFHIFNDHERLLIDFGRDDGPPGVPRWSVESPTEGGYVRVHFPGVASTKIAGKDLIGSVMDELYVVRGPDGGLFADVFATHAFRYRVTELPESGRLAVDFRGVREELDLPPTTGDRAVVVQPREAEEVGSPITVQGYTRLFEGQVTVTLLSRERKVISRKTVRASDWASTWGLFGATLEFSGYEGLATLRVGSGSARDGSFVGTETEVFLE